MTQRLLLLPGDGIGPEVVAEVRRVLAALAPTGLEVAEADFGGVAIDRHGMPLPADTQAAALSADAVLMGAVGGPKWASEPYANRPEAGLLQLRERMGVFANLRPVRCFPGLETASTLKPEVVAGLDILFVRELVGGVYFGEPRGISEGPDGERVGLNTQRYSESEIRRCAAHAFALARQRKRKVVSVDKANVMESGLLWRETVQALRDADYPDVALAHLYADNAAMQLVRRPAQFDVILTDNLFGDLLSDLAAELSGSIGLLPSAALGEPGQPGLYEPIHGSAPDIAGQGIANPLAAILSLALAFRHSLGRADLADRVEVAVARSIAAGARTRDLGGTLGTGQMGKAVVETLGRPGEQAA
jgi:3-isopropylmalate dehydrogenase